jgi:two-component system, OmpR family, sensor kinase
MFTHSIRWRLQSWLAFLLVCVLTGFGFTVYQLQRVNQINQIDDELAGRVAALNLAVRGGPGPLDRGPGREPFDRPPPPMRQRPNAPSTDAPPMSRERFEGPPPGRPGRIRPGFREIKLSAEVAGLFDEGRTNGFYFAIWSSDGVLLKRSANAPATVPLPAHLGGDTRTHTRMRGGLREAFQFTEMEDCVLAGRSMTEDFQAHRRFAFVLLAAGGAVLALGLGGGWWLTTRAIHPIEQISAAASRISAGSLSERVAVEDPKNELGRLAGVLNSTFARLEAAFAQQKQFTADASHELRTPLAVIISEAQTTLARERSPAEYRETIETCLEAAQQMRRLAQSLLELARIDAGQENIERKHFDLAEQARASAELVRPLARERGLKFSSDLGPAQVFGDPERIGQVITNLLTNAIHYNNEHGEIRVATGAQGDAAILTVTGAGRGIAPEDLPHIFERFYRADKSRAHGQSGLGLAICKAIVDAHGGTIEVFSKPGEGAAFIVRLPV